MGVSSSIQFRGLENALQAYVNKDVSCWSIWQGKQMLDKGQDAETLRAFLELLEASNSEAIYTVRVYEDITDPKKIKSGTQDDGSFNFRLNEPNQLPAPYRVGNYDRGNFRRGESLEDRFAELEDKISGFIESHTTAPAVPEEDTLQGAFIGLLKDPDKLGKFIDVTKNLLGQSSQPSYIGNVHRLQETPSLSPSTNGAASASNLSAEEKLTRLGAAIDALEKADPDLVPHLEKLAKVATENPRQFSQLITMLDVI
jgi:hypothetical protein